MDDQREIYFAGGCFWGVEEYFSRIPGVIATEVGYANGSTESPTYAQVCRMNTGHAETVHIVYDHAVVSLDALLRRFFDVIDPTAQDRQGNDTGVQYRTGIYYTDEWDRDAIGRFISREQKNYAKPIVTELLPLRGFYPAEEEHQKYLKKNPGGYCHIDFRTLDNTR